MAIAKEGEELELVQSELQVTAVQEESVSVTHGPPARGYMHVRACMHTHTHTHTETDIVDVLFKPALRAIFRPTFGRL